MKNSRFKQSYRKTASHLHQAVGEVLRAPPFSGYKTYQEYPTWRINRECSNKRLHFDWVVLDLKLIIECHGEFHYQPVKMTYKTSDREALLAFQDLQQRDLLKKEYAFQAGYSYVVVPHWDISLVSATYLLDKIPDTIQVKAQAPSRKLEQRERARAWRKEVYKNFKEYRDAHQKHSRLSSSTSNKKMEET